MCPRIFGIFAQQFRNLQSAFVQFALHPERVRQTISGGFITGVERQRLFCGSLGFSRLPAHKQRKRFRDIRVRRIGRQNSGLFDFSEGRFSPVQQDQDVCALSTINGLSWLQPQRLVNHRKGLEPRSRLMH
jgi:hypothetical protein